MNRPLVFCAIFVAGLAIGGAASWLILDQGDRPKPAGGTAPTLAAAAPAPAPEQPPVITPAPSLGSRPAVVHAAPKPFAESSERVAGDRGYETAGTGTITGRVKNDKGQPVAGVIVRAEFQGDRQERSSDWRNGDGVPQEKDMSSAVQRFIEDTEKARSMRKEATTGDNGEFTLTGLLDDRYSMHAYLKGWDVKPDQGNYAWNARPGMNVDFTATKIVIVPVDVHLADGSAPKKAELEIRVQNSSHTESWRPDRPDLRLGTGAYAISASAGDHHEWHAEAQNVVLTDAAAPSPLSFKLVARTGIHGRIQVPKGYAIDSLSVWALRYSGASPPDENALKNGTNQWASQWGGYEFSFEDLAAGTYLVGAGTWESVFATRTVEVKPNVINEIVLEITDAGASGLVVKVVGPDGGAIGDANVRVHSSVGRDGSEPFAVRPKKDGAWVIVAKKDSPADLKDWFVQAHSERYGEKNVPLPSVTAGGELRIEMAEPGTLEVTITGYAGSGLEGRVRLDAQPILPGKDQGRRYYSYSSENGVSPEGRQTIRSLQPGKYRVELQYMQERWNGTALDHVDTEVASGQNHVSIAAPAVYSLTVIAAGESPGASFGLQQVGGEGRWNRAQLKADGTAVFEGLLAGTYRVVLYSKVPRQRSMKMTVPAGGPVTFKEDIEVSLVIRTLDSEGYLASVGLQAGDVITGIEGTAFDGSLPAAQVLQGLSAAKKELKLQLARAGKALEVTVDSEKLSAATSYFRNLEPGTR